MNPSSKSYIFSRSRLIAVVTLSLVAGLGVTSCAGSYQRKVEEAISEVGSTRYPPQSVSGGLKHSSPAGELSETADFNAILRYAALNNPGLEAAFQRWKAAAERIPQVKTLDDPRFTFSYLFEEVETRVGPQRQRFGLSQMFPWFGTLRLRGDVAAHNALIAEQRFQATEDRLFLEVVEAYTEYYYLGRSIAITAELIGLVSNAESVAQAKYRAGVGPYADVIRAQVELGRLEDRLIALEDQVEPVLARLNAALNRPADAPLALPTELPMEPLTLTDEELIERAKRNNPDLRALELLADREERSIALAKRRFLPNFTLGVSYLNTGEAGKSGVLDSGKDPVIGSFSINIPIWRGAYSAGVKEATARRRAAELEHADRMNLIESRMEQLLFTFHDAERKISLYQDALIPKARQSVQASSAGYEAGEIDFLNFLDAERVLLNFELAHDRARTDRLGHLAALRALVGSAYNQTAEESR